MSESEHKIIEILRILNEQNALIKNNAYLAGLIAKELL